MSVKLIVRSSLPADIRVSELIGPNHRWNEALIQQNFAADDGEAIMRIHLPSEPKEDGMLWHYDKGNYSVKSGYQLALKIKFPDKPCCSNSDPQGWQTIWKLGIPEKVKIFLWKAAKNFLPTMENLWKRKVVQEPICQICKKELENIPHALLDCKLAKKMWRHTHIAAEVQNEARQDLLSMLQSLTKKTNNQGD